MGNNISKQPTYTTHPTTADGDDELVMKLQSLLVSPNASASASTDDPVTSANLNEWTNELLSDPTKRLAINCLTGNDITNVIANTAKQNANNIDLFNHQVKFEGPITNQRASGRCWLFASTNVFKEFMKEKYNLEAFEFSQNYLFFYDKLEKCNWFLNRIMESSEEEIDSRLVQFLMALPQNDGGQWDMVVNLVEKYGLVPKSIYQDSASSMNSSRLNYFVNNKLREFALILRKLKTEENSEKGCSKDINVVKENMMKEIHSILSLTLGVPPDPSDVITWEYKDKFGNFHSISTSPLEFYKNCLPYDAATHYSLIHDPRNPHGLYTVDKLGNIEGGKPIEYVNTSLDSLKQAAIAMIKANQPVFFGSDVGKFEDTSKGLMDTNSWDYSSAFGIDMKINKKERLMTASSQMTHAMVLTGVHVINGKPVRWKVENSWGEVGHKGWFVMSDDWFNEYVFQVVVDTGFAKEEEKVWKDKQYKVLPYYDPMGALA